jgi:hypothetical protein
VKNEVLETRVAIRMQRLFRSWSAWNVMTKKMRENEKRLGAAILGLQKLFRGYRWR